MISHMGKNNGYPDLVCENVNYYPTSIRPIHKDGKHRARMNSYYSSFVVFSSFSVWDGHGI